METGLNLAFEKVKPSCLALLTSSTTCRRGRIIDYLEAVSAISDSELSVLAEYVIFPPLALLSNAVEPEQGQVNHLSRKSETSEYWSLASALVSVAGRIYVPKGTFLKIVHVLTLGLEEKAENQNKSSARLLLNLLSTCQRDNVRDCFDPRAAPLLAGIVFHFCHLVRTNESCDRNADFLLLDVLDLLCDSETLTSTASNVLGSFLPGISAALASIGCRDKSVSSKVTTRVLKAYGYLLSACMSNPAGGDERLETVESSGADENENKVVLALRDEKWFKSTWEQVKIVLKQLLLAEAGEPTDDIRLGKLFLVSRLSKCHLLPDEVKTNLVLSVVFESYGLPSPAVRDAAQEIVADLESSCAMPSCAKEFLTTHVISLPRKILGHSFGLERRKTLAVVCGALNYLTAAGGIPTFLLQRCMDCLLQVCELNVSRTHIAVSQDLGYPDLTLQHFPRGSSEEEILFSTISCLTRKSVALRCFVHLTSALSRSQTNCAALYLLLSFSDEAVLSEENVANLVQLLVAGLDQIEVDENVEDALVDSKTFACDKSTVCLCVTIRLLGTLSRVAHFDANARSVIGYLLKFSASKQAAVAISSRSALDEIARNTSFSTVAEFLAHHASDVVSSVVLQLRHFDLYPSCPVIFSSFVVYFMDGLSPEVALILSGMILDVLPILDAFHEVQCHAILRVLKCALHCMARDPPPGPQKTPDSDEESAEKPSIVHATCEVLARTKHLIKIRHQHLALICMDILNDGLRILGQWEDDLLPLVHQNWAPLVTTFDLVRADPYVQRAAFFCVATMSEVAKDFVQRRFMEEFWPKLNTVMTLLAKSSDKCSTFYKSSPKFRLQLAVMENLETVLRNVDLRRRDADSFRDFVEMYASETQPEELRGCAVKLKRYLECTKSDL